MITFNNILDKFLEKGYTFIEVLNMTNMYCYINFETPPPNVNSNEWLYDRRKILDEINQPELEYWNTWIDYQKHK